MLPPGLIKHIAVEIIDLFRLSTSHKGKASSWASLAVKGLSGFLHLLSIWIYRNVWCLVLIDLQPNRAYTYRDDYDGEK